MCCARTTYLPRASTHTCMCSHTHLAHPRACTHIRIHLPHPYPHTFPPCPPLSSLPMCSASGGIPVGGSELPHGLPCCRTAGTAAQAALGSSHPRRKGERWRRHHQRRCRCSHGSLRGAKNPAQDGLQQFLCMIPTPPLPPQYTHMTGTHAKSPVGVEVYTRSLSHGGY